MRTHTPLFRLAAALTAASLMAAVLPQGPARAQAAPDQLDPQAPQADPPARVGRLGLVSGTVSYHTAGEAQWTRADMNFPVASGSSFWTDPQAEAELQLSSSRLSLAGGTEIDIAALDGNGLQATLTQGKALLRPRDLTTGEVWTVQTPRGTLTTAHAGHILIAAGDTESPTIVSVLDGNARITGAGFDQILNGGQAAIITGTDSFQVVLGAIQPDAFAQAVMNRERPALLAPARAGSVPPPPMVAALPGGEDLSRYGVWSNSPDYGEVWYPSVEAGWVPYRQGHWAFIAPWGWTWVDDAPWGFAPFHYGRWVEVYGRWAWTPGFEHERRFGYPVYAPALVTFVGIGAGVALGAAFAAGSVSWIPLGPREAYHPWYRASPRYLGVMNANHPVSFANAGSAEGFRNRGAATIAPAAAMAGSSPLRGVARPLPGSALAGARPLMGQQPINPSFGAAGLTPSAARQMGIAPNAGGPAHMAAPGPVITPRAGFGAAPALRPPGTTNGAFSGGAPGGGAGGAGMTRPGLGLGVTPASPGMAQPFRGSAAPATPHPGQPGFPAGNPGTTPQGGAPLQGPSRYPAGGGSAPFSGHSAAPPVNAAPFHPPASVPSRVTPPPVSQPRFQQQAPTRFQQQAPARVQQQAPVRPAVAPHPPASAPPASAPATQQRTHPLGH